MSDNCFKYEKIVIGNDLPALVYAHLTCSPLFYTKFEKPKRFEYFDSKTNLDIFSINNQNKIKTFEGEKIVGPSKWELFERLMWIHSISGFVPFGENIEKIDVAEDRLKVVAKKHLIYEISFEKAVVFQDEPDIAIEFKMEKKAEKPIKVYDHFFLENNLFEEPNYFVMNRETRGFAKEIHMLKKRNDGARNLILSSYVTKKNLLLESHNMISAKMIIKNTFAEKLNMNSSELWQDLELEHLYRTESLEGLSVYENSKTVDFFYMTVPRILTRYGYIPCNPLKKVNERVAKYVKR